MRWNSYLSCCPDLNLQGSDNNDLGKLTFHDSCYLGRYNNIYDQPRELLKKADLSPLEMKKSKEESFCCGGGGGAMWLETAADTRIKQTPSSTSSGYSSRYYRHSLSILPDHV